MISRIKRRIHRSRLRCRRALLSHKQVVRHDEIETEQKGRTATAKTLHNFRQQKTDAR